MYTKTQIRNHAIRMGVVLISLGITTISLVVLILLYLISGGIGKTDFTFAELFNVGDGWYFIALIVLTFAIVLVGIFIDAFKKLEGFELERDERQKELYDFNYKMYLGICLADSIIVVLLSFTTEGPIRFIFYISAVLIASSSITDFIKNKKGLTNERHEN